MGKLCVVVGVLGMLISGGCSLVFMGDIGSDFPVILVFGVGPFILSVLLFMAGRKLNELGE